MAELELKRELELERELDPIIWGKAPHDILLEIIQHSDVSTQVNWSCTSRALSLYVSSKIWSSLRIYSSEITLYALLVSGRKLPRQASSIVHFLLESSYRRHNLWDHVLSKDRTFIYQPNGLSRYRSRVQLVATLPISQVKDLEIDNQGFDNHEPICDEMDIDLFMLVMLRRLRKLQSFRYLGPLSAKSLAAIMQANNLRVLQVRNSNDVLETIHFNHTRTAAWADPVLDWSVLANLKSLQGLEVGRLIRQEAEGLAKGITALDLLKLRVSCWGWEYDGVVLIRNRRHTAHVSALIILVNALLMLDPRNSQALHGFPSTLKHLVLIDKYHTCVPSLFQYLTTAILPCEDLETLDTTISVTGVCYDALSKMGLPAYHKIIGLHSWQQLSCDEGIKVLHQYHSPGGETLQTDPYPSPLRNLAKTLDFVAAAAKGLELYRMSMNFVRERQLRSDEILIYPCEGAYIPYLAEKGPQANDASMENLAANFASMSFREEHWHHMLRTWGMWSQW